MIGGTAALSAASSLGTGTITLDGGGLRFDAAMTMSSEWEGHAYLDLEDQDAFDLVSRHQAMCRRFLAASAGA